jgi:hypothetical protein
VYWRTGLNAGATLTTANFLGTILSGAAITVTATNGTLQGDLFATTAVTLTLTNSTVTACQLTGIHGNTHGKCNQGVGGPRVAIRATRTTTTRRMTRRAGRPGTRAVSPTGKLRTRRNERRRGAVRPLRPRSFA